MFADDSTTGSLTEVIEDDNVAEGTLTEIFEDVEEDIMNAEGTVTEVVEPEVVYAEGNLVEVEEFTQEAEGTLTEIFDDEVTEEAPFLQAETDFSVVLEEEGINMGLLTLAALAIILVLGYVFYKRQIASLKVESEESKNDAEMKRNLVEALLTKEVN